ncbi:MAG: hypothetical protein ACLFRY_02660 [Spirochaetia bacterium]
MFEKIVELENEIEAGLMKAVLDERDIPFRIRSYHDSAYDGIFQAQLGWGHIEAPAEFTDQIRRIHSDILADSEKEK